MARIAPLTAALLLLCPTALAQGQAAPSESKAAAPAALPQDQHDGLTVSVDPYTESSRAKDKFGKANPREAGILPLEVFFRNDTDKPLRVNLETIQLEVGLKNGSRQQIDWLTPAEVATLIAHPGGTPTPQTRRLPIPSIGGDKKADKLAEILKPLTFDADIIPPKATMRGFLYFNLSNEMSLVSTSKLFVPDVTIAPSNQPLVYFEVPLRAAQTP